MTVQAVPIVTRDWRRWKPKTYLHQYYKTETIPSDELAILSRILPYLQSQPYPFERAIDVGAGPTLHHAIALVPYVNQLHLSDYVRKNLEESKNWLEDKPTAHNWDIYIRGILALEHSKDTVEERKRLLRQKITKLLKVDITKKHPLGEKNTYPLVTSFYCADSVAQTKKEWKSYMHNLFTLVEPRGTLIVSALHKATHYQVGAHAFPSANIQIEDLTQILKNNFNPHTLDIHASPVPEWIGEGFDSILIAIAQKNS